MAVFAVMFQVYTITGSSLAVGGIGLCAAVPSVLFGLVGGSISDAMDRRRLVLLSTSALAVLSGVLTVAAFADFRHLWLYYLLTAAQSLLGSVNAPARRSIVPRIVSRDQLAAASALHMTAMHISGISGPLLGGLVIALWGVEFCFLVDTASFVLALYGVARLPAISPAGTPTRPGWRSMTEGLRFVRSHRALRATFLGDLSLTLLGVPFALFPAINQENFGGNPGSLGLLVSAVGVGGLLGSLMSGPLSAVSRIGRAQLAVCLMWSLTIIGFSLSNVLALSVALLVLAGAGDTIGVILRTTLLQRETPDALLGRVNSLDFVVGVSGPHLGGFRAGLVSSWTSAGVSALSGGISSAAAIVVLWACSPALLRYTTDEVAATR